MMEDSPPQIAHKVSRFERRPQVTVSPHSRSSVYARDIEREYNSLFDGQSNRYNSPATRVMKPSKNPECTSEGSSFTLTRPNSLPLLGEFEEEAHHIELPLTQRDDYVPATQMPYGDDNDEDEVVPGTEMQEHVGRMNIPQATCDLQK